MLQQLCISVITPIRREDLPTLVTLEQQCFSTSWSTDQYATFLSLNVLKNINNSVNLKGYFQRSGSETCAGKAIGFFIKGELCGYIIFFVQYTSGELEIYSLAVKASCRRKQMARTLLTKLIACAQTTGFRKILLEVKESNIPALSLYRDLGFMHYATRKQYYPDTGEDALMLERLLFS